MVLKPTGETVAVRFNVASTSTTTQSHNSIAVRLFTFLPQVLFPKKPVMPCLEIHNE